jgi:uncharacterized protein with HEPN domain
VNPNKPDDVYLAHMLECIDRIEQYTKSNREVFFQSTLVQDAVIRNLQTMAESSQRLSEELKQIQPEIQWRDIAGFRNIVVHDYLGVDLDLIWRVVEYELPVLKVALIAMRKRASD